MTDVSLIIEALVAVGTFALAGATFWLGWNTRQERKATEARELAVGAYDLLRPEILNWADPEAAYTIASRDVWTGLKQNQLHLVARIPEGITSLLDAAEKDVGRASFLRFKVTGTTAKIMDGLSAEFYPQRQPGSLVLLRLIVGKMYVRSVDPDLVWFSRKSFKDYVNDFVAKRFSKDAWEIELYVGSTVSGGTKEAEKYSEMFSGFLDKDKEANELRELAYKISSQGKLINSEIEKQVKKH